MDLDPRLRTALASVNPNSKQPAWHGAPTALGVLRGVDAALAVWRPYAGANNIREVALHLAFWENSVANRLAGTDVAVGFAQRETGWPLRLEALADADWRGEVGLVKDARRRLAEAVAAFDPALLDAPLGPRSSRPAAEIIHGVAEHSLYHTAQLEMIRALARRTRSA